MLILKNINRRRNAFTMVEMMAAVTISIILILLMYGIFDKVQTVFVVGQNRAHAMEGARAAMDMLKRDFESMDISQPYNLFLLNNDGVFKSSQPYELKSLKTGRMQSVDGSFTMQYMWGDAKFISKDDGYRQIEYKYGGRNYYDALPEDSPVGAIWLWRSPVVVSKSQLSEKKAIHRSQIQDFDRANMGGGYPENLVAYGKMIDGVIHFGVRKVTPAVEGARETHLEIEIAVLDQKLMKEVEYGLGQALEGETNSFKYQRRMELILENLDRVYFFRQLVRLN